MALNDIFQVTILGTNSGVNWANTMLLQQTSGDGVDPPQDEVCHTLLLNLWVATLLPLLSDEVAITGRRSRRIQPTPGPGYFYPEAEAGGVAAAGHPPVSAAVIALLTNVPLRSGRGRMKLTGTLLTNVVDGRLTEAAATALETAFLPLLSPMVQAVGAATFRAGMYVGPGSFAPFTSIAVRPRMKTQRSRQLS